MNNSRVPEIEHVMPQQHGYSLTGGLFNKYELGKLLGCGAFAKVYHARNISTGQSVAIKVINKKKITTASMMTNVKREISIMRRLNHQHIVKLHEVMATKSKIYFVMEFVKGGELFAKVAKGRFSEDLARKYFQQLISAVGYCHVRGVFHRDLKPENLLLDENGNLKVTDFGLSAVKDQIRSDGLLHTLCGTPAYVAPEILAKKGYDGAKIDVWSCGVILFVLTSGYLPFRDPNLMVMYKKIYKGEYRCPKWMSQDLRRFLARLLDTNPDTRITIDEVLLDPWFKKGCKEIKFYEDFYDIEAKDSCFKDVTLNAFDLISFSSGLDLSGLFDKSYNATEDAERVVAKSSPERLVGEMEEVMKREGLKVRKKGEWGLEIEGQKGNFVMEVDVYVLTEEFVVVEGRRRAGDGGCCWEIWREKVKPLVIGGCSSSSDSDSASSTSINVEEGSRIVIAAEN